jgi:hypothetical protein
MPVSGLSSRNTNPPDTLMRGIVNIPGFKAVTIGTGRINWGLDPYKNIAWRRLFHSLKWVESLTDAYTRTGNVAYLNRARAIGQDYAAHVATGGGAYPTDIWTPMYTGQRSTVFSCLEAKGGSAPWLTTAMSNHGSWLATHDAGDWNQGVDATIGLLSSACRVGNKTWASIADTRFQRMSTATIGPEGEVLEQAPGYGSYLYGRWRAAVDKLRGCGRPVPAALTARLPGMRDFIAWATTPAGTVEQIGDTFATAAEAAGASDALGFAVSRGASGTPPATTTRLFGAGYGFGRDAWSPFGSSTYWTARWGPGRAYHGHEDHMSLTFHALGQPLLIDSGHYGNITGVYREYVLGPWAHNTTVASGAKFTKGSTTTLLRSVAKPGWTWLEMRDAAWDGRARTRRVLFDTQNKTIVVADAVSRANAGGWLQLWHLPVGAKVSVSGRSGASAVTANGVAKVNLQQVVLPGQVLPKGSAGMYSGSTSPYVGWVSRTNNERVAAPVVRFARGDRTTTIVTVISGGSPSSSMSAVARAEGKNTAIDVTVSGRRTTYYMSGGDSLWR